MVCKKRNKAEKTGNITLLENYFYVFPIFIMIFLNMITRSLTPNMNLKTLWCIIYLHYQIHDNVSSKEVPNLNDCQRSKQHSPSLTLLNSSPVTPPLRPQTHFIQLTVSAIRPRFTLLSVQGDHDSRYLSTNKRHN